MNRAPSSHDTWWNDHQKSCGGTFIKIKEPENYSQKGKNKNKDSIKDTEKTKQKGSASNSKKVTDWFKSDKPNSVNKTTDQNDKLNSEHGNALKNDSFWKNKTVTSRVQGFQETGSEGPTTYEGSSENASSNIHGFKMSAVTENVKPVASVSFSGSGVKLGSSTAGNRESFLKKIEAKALNTKKRTFGDGTVSAVKLRKTDDGDKSVCSSSSRGSKYMDKIDTIQNNRDKKSTIPNSVRTVLPNNRVEDIMFNKRTKSEVKIDVITNYPEMKRTPEVHKTNEHVDAKISFSPDIICLDDTDDSLVSGEFTETLVDCPACPAKIPEHELNKHLDMCLA